MEGGGKCVSGLAYIPDSRESFPNRQTAPVTLGVGLLFLLIRDSRNALVCGHDELSKGLQRLIPQISVYPPNSLYVAVETNLSCVSYTSRYPSLDGYGSSSLSQGSRPGDSRHPADFRALLANTGFCSFTLGAREFL